MKRIERNGTPSLDTSLPTPPSNMSASRSVPHPAQSSIGMTLQVSVEKRNQISQVTARGLTTIQDLKFDKGILESTQTCRSIESEWSNESK